MTNLAIITARGGSKRIPRKNVKGFLGQPMLKYAIDACLGSKIFDEVMVSTDDVEIAQIAIDCGAKVPFMRSEKTSTDYASTYDVLEEVVNEYKKLGFEFENFCCVYPCVPFLTADILKSAYEKFSEEHADTLMPIVKFSYPIQRALKIEQGLLKFAQPEHELTRSQDLEPMYHDVGMFYFAKIESMLNNGTLIKGKVIPFEMNESQIQDIDNFEDWKMAEIKYKVLQEASKASN